MVWCTFSALRLSMLTLLDRDFFPSCRDAQVVVTIKYPPLAHKSCGLHSSSRRRGQSGLATMAVVGEVSMERFEMMTALGC